ncbi:hypothetical protein [Nostoc sp. WHI]|nr:hypothetical protein [Nostoc sp. WHI]
MLMTSLEAIASDAKMGTIKEAHTMLWYEAKKFYTSQQYLFIHV